MRALTPALSLALLLAATPASAQVEIRVATLAPQGSAWANIMEKSNARLQTVTAGRARMHIYFGGQQGDERDVVRKMKLGQLDAAALTTVGLGLIVPDVLVLQLPYLFSDVRQVDFVRDRLAPDFEKAFDEAGYVLLSWGDVGWAHTYSTERFETKEALTRAKVWQWADDPIVREYFTLLGVNGVPLALPEVLTALQTGTVQVCFGPPLAAIALQWHTKIKFMSDRPSAYGIGAFVIKKETFQRLTPEDQQRLRDGGRETGAELRALVRRDNERARKAMVKSGIVVFHVPDEAQAKLMETGKQVWGRLAGKLYSKAILDKVLAAIASMPPS